MIQAKKFVESLPKVLKENATKEEAEKLKKALEAVGAQVTLGLFYISISSFLPPSLNSLFVYTD